MLCDAFLDLAGRRIEASAAPGGAGIDQRRAFAAIQTALRRAQRFVLSPLVVATCRELAEPDKLDASRDHLFTPAVTTWIEWSDDDPPPGLAPHSHRHGLLLDGHGADKTNLAVGDGIYAYDHPAPDRDGRIVQMSHAFVYDFPGSGHAFRPYERGDEPPDWTDLPLNWGAIGAFACAALALINTPRISDVRHHDQTKLNAARARRGKPPVLSYGEVHLKVDAGALRGAHQVPSAAGRPVHHVRAHLRIRFGKVELVRPHWRGDPAIGVRVQRHVVRKQDEEAGPWKGEPLPGPTIIKTKPA